MLQLRLGSAAYVLRVAAAICFTLVTFLAAATADELPQGTGPATEPTVATETAPSPPDPPVPPAEEVPVPSQPAEVPASGPVDTAQSAAELEQPQAKLAALPSVDVGALWYLASQFGETGGADFSQARLSRGYVTFTFKMAKWFEPRVTVDTTQTEEGDWMVRLKYMYAKLKIPMETKYLTDPNVEIGLVHGPWFDYEEHIDLYRAQGTMFIERNGVLNSADAGVTVAGLFGKKLPKSYQDSVSKYYPGEYGSFAFGVYNGGGYHAAETNENKVFESRISVRPAGPVLPNLQLSHFLVVGKGNTEHAPAWMINVAMASYEHEYFAATAQYAAGKGNQKGTKVDASGDALALAGYSGFAEIKLPAFKSSLIGRYDVWEWDLAEGGSETTTRVIAGYAYHFLPHNFVLLDVDYATYDTDREAAWQVAATVQVSYP